MASYDSIIIGAGHNGLVCAGYLAKAGQRVLVVEASDRVGGLAGQREFHPGFRVAPAHAFGHFSKKVATDLKLESFSPDRGTAPMKMIGLGPEGEHVCIDQGGLTGGDAADADAYGSFQQLMRRLANALDPFWSKTMPRIGSHSLADLMTFAQVGLKLRRLGKKDMQEFLRVASLPARDLMDEYFEDDLVKALLSWDGIVGAKMAPRSPNSAVLAMLYRMGEVSSGAHGFAHCDVGAMMDALVKSAQDFGAELITEAAVDRILIGAGGDGLSATGIRLHNGEEITANRVVSSADPQRTFFGMVGVEFLDIGFTNRIRRLRCDGYVAKLHLALESAPKFAGLEEPDGRLIIAPTMDAIEYAFDDAKYGECPSVPVMEIVVPSLHNSAQARDSGHVLSAHVMYVPYRLNGGWTDEARDTICRRAIDTLADYAPDIRDQIIASELLTPPDLEREYNVTGGHWHHAEFAMDQMLMMRPTYGAAQYRTPIPGLYLCGAGCHPGGDLTGFAGHNAAQEILR